LTNTRAKRRRGKKKQEIRSNLRKVTTRFCRSCRCCSRGDEIQPLNITLPVRSVNSLICNETPFAYYGVYEEIVETIIEQVTSELLYHQKVNIILMSLEPDDINRTKEVETAFHNSLRVSSENAKFLINQVTSEGAASLVSSFFMSGAIFAFLEYLSYC